MGNLGRWLLRLHRQWERSGNALFSRLVRGGFAQFGNRSHISRLINLTRPDPIDIGRGVYSGPGCWLQALTEDDNADARVEVGGESSLTGHDVISSARRLAMEPGVLFAPNAYASNHSHSFDDPTRHIHDQGVDQTKEVAIEGGAWLRQNLVVCPGVRMGRGAVIGAGSVVREDIPPHSVAVGAPARVVKQVAEV